MFDREIWDFDDRVQFPTWDLLRVLDIHKELKAILGESPLSSTMIAEINDEVGKRLTEDGPDEIDGPDEMPIND